MKPGFEAVIGLEIHIQLRTRSKMFCACENAVGGAPNSRTCPICLGLPGTLPTLNAEAVRMALALGLALEARIEPVSSFYRKQYFYADLPKGYQITQGPVPIVAGGCLRIPGDPAVRGQIGPISVPLERAHLEEDAGKSTHELSPGASLVDLNRAGVPLLELVGTPALRSPQEAYDFFKTLHHLVVWLGICDGNMEEGSLRCDANVSVRRTGATAFGTRVEVKNLNSFRYVKQALEFELDRQIEVLEAGGSLTQETRGWDAAKGITLSQRSKEAAMDYRYFPEPDLPPLVISLEELAAVRAQLKELPETRRARFQESWALSDFEATTLTQSEAFADYFEAVVKHSGNAKASANWMLGELSRTLNDQNLTLEALKLRPEDLAALIDLVERKVINLNTAKEQVFPALLAGEGPAADIVATRGLAQVSDRGAIADLVAQVLAAHASQVLDLKAGKTNLRGFLVGQIMKAGKGKVNPQLVNEALDAALAKENP